MYTGDEDEIEEEAKQSQAIDQGNTPSKSSDADTGYVGSNDTGSDINTFTGDLKSYIPKPTPSLLSTVDLVKSLNSFYMLTWTKQLIRELFSITDQKIQDYSPNENQKVWDKPIHRKHVSQLCLFVSF